jgi:WD40 repeat protein
MRFKNTEAGVSRSVWFSPDGQFVTFISGNTLQFWSTSTGKLLSSFASDAKSIALQPEGKLLATTTMSTVQVYQLSY